ncbi:MAG: hypothetical protein VKP62_15520 [Candidatus Sericytochromatia bacterium]|nr:hypothetical protein [Candidatus Sericytochromatia bacterium]
MRGIKGLLECCACLVALNATWLVTGCGTARLASLPVEPASLQTARFGFGAEGGAQPALCVRQDGTFVLVYESTRTGDRHLRLATSRDGRVWSTPEWVARGEFTDKSPALLEDAVGGLHLYFISNRDGAHPQVYHSLYEGTSFSAADPLTGLDGAQDLAVTRVGDQAVLVAEVMGAGVVAFAGAPGRALKALPAPATAGAEPAVCAASDGRVVVAFQREGKIVVREGRPGEWGPEVVAASAASRLRDPALLWREAGGMLTFAERGEAGLALRHKAFDAQLAFVDTDAPALGEGEARGAAWATSGRKTLLAWGMKLRNGQQGVMVTTR